MVLTVTKKQYEIIKAIGVLYSNGKDVNPNSVSKVVKCDWHTAKKHFVNLKNLKGEK